MAPPYDEPPVNKSNVVAAENTSSLRALISQMNDYPTGTNVTAPQAFAASSACSRRHRAEVENPQRRRHHARLNTAIRYIEGVGMTDAYDVEVIRYHFQTIGRIILDMPEEAFLHRTTVAGELERLVAKKIASAIEGADAA